MFLSDSFRPGAYPTDLHIAKDIGSCARICTALMRSLLHRQAVSRALSWLRFST
jgi:hypothetical protein